MCCLPKSKFNVKKIWRSALSAISIQGLPKCLSRYLSSIRLIVCKGSKVKIFWNKKFISGFFSSSSVRYKWMKDLLVGGHLLKENEIEDLCRRALYGKLFLSYSLSLSLSLSHTHTLSPHAQIFLHSFLADWQLVAHTQCLLWKTRKKISGIVIDRFSRSTS